MPKNPHPPRSGASKKPKAPAAIKEEDTSFIVFGNGNEKKGRRGAASGQNDGASNAQDTKGKGKATDAAQSEEQPKRPDTRKLIGGASWTGKLPVNMLSEHCQKQKWARPDYRTVSSVIRSHYICTELRSIEMVTRIPLLSYSPRRTQRPKKP